jgi:hypothetical protein
MALQPHQERVLEERRELDEKIHKLTVFIASARIAQVSLAESRRLYQQLQIMLDYSRVLQDRINAFDGS